ncbi:hypothetical protein ACH4PU_34115 [Streptomyces sp. NPDC021100]|uniref:hypothetical protein n=1 Tax=Streptomyces sp. NPDC021100 TaxID=3365114 RepID=UPI003792D559
MSPWPEQCREAIAWRMHEAVTAQARAKVREWESLRRREEVRAARAAAVAAARPDTACPATEVFGVPLVLPDLPGPRPASVPETTGDAVDQAASRQRAWRSAQDLCPEHGTRPGSAWTSPVSRSAPHDKPPAAPAAAPSSPRPAPPHRPAATVAIR